MFYSSFSFELLNVQQDKNKNLKCLNCFFFQTALTDGTHWWEIYGSGRGLAAESGLGPGLGLGSWVLGPGTGLLSLTLVPNLVFALLLILVLLLAWCCIVFGSSRA